MKKSAITLIMIALTLGSSAYALEAAGTYEDARILAARHNKPLLIDFFTTW